MYNKTKTKFNQWVQLAECKTLTASQRIILITILNLHNIEGWDFTPLSKINEKNGLSVSTIQRSIDGLVKMKLIEKVPNHNRKKHGKAPNDYIPNYNNIIDFLNNQIGQNDHNNQIGQNDHNNQIGQNDHNDYSQNEHNIMVKMTNKNNRRRKKEKNKASIYNNNINLSTRRYMVYSENENENKQNTNDMNIIITNETENGNPINALLGFDKAFEKGWDSSSNVEETAADTENTPNKAHSEEIIPQVDNYTTAVEKTPQERDLEGNLEKKTADEETDSPNNGANTADTTNTLSIEDTQRIMSQAAQTIMKNRKHAADTTENGANTATYAQKAPKNNRGEEIIPQVDNYTTAAKTTPQERYFDNMGADTADTTENGADTAEVRPIYNTIHAADEWAIRNTTDKCWQETFEHINIANPTESQIRNILNQIYKDWKNRDQAINAKMITDMKKYVEYKYQMDLNKKEKRDTVTCHNPKSDAYPTVTEIENLDLCHISKNRDILNRLSAGCTRLDTVIISLQKASEFVQIYRIATPQLYECISNAMATINNYPTVSDKKAKYITDLATHLCDMLDKVC